VRTVVVLEGAANEVVFDVVVESGTAVEISGDATGAVDWYGGIGVVEQRKVEVLGDGNDGTIGIGLLSKEPVVNRAWVSLGRERSDAISDLYR